MSNSENPTALVPVSSLKPPTCALKPFEELEAAGEKAISALRALGEEGALSTDVRQQVKALINRANPKKKGLDEDVSVEWQIPEILIKQKSTELQGALPENVKDGDIIAVIQRKACLGILQRPFRFRVLFEYQSNVKFEAGTKAPVCTSPDAKLGAPQGECAKCPDLPMGQQPGGFAAQKQTDCSYNLCYIVIDETYQNIYEVKFAKTSMGAGRALATLVRASDNAPWDKLFILETEKKTNESGTYYIYKVAPAGDSPIDEEHSKVCDALSDLYASTRHKLLHRWYAGARNAGQNAAAAEQGFNPSGLNDGLGGEGAEPDFSEAPASKPAAKLADKGKSGNAARKSSQPM